MNETKKRFAEDARDRKEPRVAPRRATDDAEPKSQGEQIRQDGRLDGVQANLDG